MEAQVSSGPNSSDQSCASSILHADKPAQTHAEVSVESSTGSDTSKAGPQESIINSSSNERQQEGDNTPAIQVVEQSLKPICSESESGRSLDTALQIAIATDTESNDFVGCDVEMEDSYAPDPKELAPSSPQISIDCETAEVVTTATTEKIVSEMPDGESDPYEPPEASPTTSDDEPMSTNSSPFSPAPPEIIERPDTNLQPDSTSAQQHIPKFPTFSRDRPADVQPSRLTLVGVYTHCLCHILVNLLTNLTDSK